MHTPHRGAHTTPSRGLFLTPCAPYFLLLCALCIAGLLRIAIAVAILNLKKIGFKSAKRRLYIALRSTSSQGPPAIAWTVPTREIRCAREQERERSDDSGYTASKAALRAPLKQ
jgi:hypothetical protein